MAIPRNLANLANQLNSDGEVPKIEVGNSSVVVTDTGSNGTIAFTTEGSERMRIDSSGNVGIGTNNPTVKFQIEGTIPEINFISYSDTNNYGVTHRYRMAKGSVSSPTTVANGNELYTLIAQGYDGSGFRSAASIRVNVDNTVGANDMPGRIGFFTTSDGSDSDTERARITSGGYFKASNSGAYGDSAGLYHELYQTAAGTNCAIFRSSSGSFTSTVLTLQCDRNTTNATYNFLTATVPGVGTRLVVADSGNITNVNGSYGTISDIKLKQDIVDASSQWDDIKNLRFRKYRLKSDVEANSDAKPLLGLIAQETELVSPGLIEEYQDTEEITVPEVDNEGNPVLDNEGNPKTKTKTQKTGTTTKSIKTSVLYMKAVKALQEAITRIETLEAEVAALKAK
jgi:hypothetical protein